MPPAHNREEALFRAAIQLPPGPAREAFLDQACAGDPVLRHRLDCLIAAHEQPGAFLEPQVAAPADAVATTVGVGPAPEETLGTIIGRYKILEKIGEGGFGAVYVAEQREPVKRRVAVKIIKLGMDTRQVVARFEAERQALALMDHPNIAKVLDAGTTETGRPYFVMELVKGIPVTQFCDQEKLPTAERLDLFIKVCHAIQHAHQKGIIHRDIKPSNILVTLHDGEPVPKVIDFGIAKATQQELTEKTVYTQFQQFIGTPAYMSPEQAELSGLDIDTRSDIYSLGVLLYELLTGNTPFDIKELMQSGLDEMRKIIREREPVRPSTRIRHTSSSATRSRLSTIHSQLSTDLDWIVMKCLEKERTRRYETANGLAMDLKRHLDNEPVVARPPSVSYRLQKSFRRNKLVFSAAVIVGLALVAGALVSTWQAVRAKKAERLAITQSALAQAAEQTARDESARAQAEQRRADAEALAARQNLYSADMLLAQQARADGNLDLALDRLNFHLPRNGEADLRGWEWRYLWAACQSDELARFATNSGCITDLKFSPDGTLLSAAEWGPSVTAVKVWAFPSGRLLQVPEPNDAAGTVAFSPDGKLLAFATKNHGLRVWNLEAGKEQTNFGVACAQGFGAGLVFSPDGRLLAASGPTSEILLCNVDTGAANLLANLHVRNAAALAFSPDGSILVIGGWDGVIRLWSLAGGRELGRLTNHLNGVVGLAFSPDGKTLLSTSMDKTIRIWDPGSQVQLRVLTNHTRWVGSLSFAPDGRTLASGSADFTIKLWDTANWREINTLRGSRDEIYAVAFSRDGRTLVSGAKNGVISTWDPSSRPREPDVQERPKDDSNSWMHDGTIFCVQTNGAITYWNPAALRQTAVYTTPSHAVTRPKCFDLTSNGRMVWVNPQGEIVLWDLAARHELARRSWAKAPDQRVFISPSERFLVGAAKGLGLNIWDLDSLQEVATFPAPRSSAGLDAVCFSPDQQLVAASHDDGTIEIWDLQHRRRIADWQAHQQDVPGLAFVPGTKRLVSVSLDATIKMWDPETLRQPISFTRTLNAFFSLAISPDGRRIAAGTFDGLVKIWDSANGREVATLRAGSDIIWWLQFLQPDGDTLVCVTSQEVRRWHAPSWAEIPAAKAKAEGQRPAHVGSR